MEQEVDAIVNSHPLGLWPRISQPQLTTVAVLCELVTALLQHTFDKCCSIAERYYLMSFRNGDKSREHRLRKARQKMRLKTRGLQTKDEAKAQSAAPSAPAK